MNHILSSKKWHTSVTSEAYILRHWDDLRHPHDPTKDKCFGTWIDGSHLKGHFRLTDTKTQCHCHSNHWWWHLWDGCQRLFWSVNIVDFSQILVPRRILNSCPTEWHTDVCVILHVNWLTCHVFWIWITFCKIILHMPGESAKDTCVSWVDVQESVAC